MDTMLPAADGPAASAVVISAVAGAAGVGKTALALHWSHRVAPRFSDGQLFANLRGCATATPTRPIEALARFLRALGVPGDQVPADLDEASALFRSLVAGRRMLILLDDAHDAGQVRPLLPGSSGCLTLVTSRDRLGGLIARDGARPLTLNVLTDDEAHHLLANLLGAPRVTAEPRATAESARLCGNLPLALRLAAANLATDPHSSIADYVARLTGDRLEALEVDGDPTAAAGLPAERRPSTPDPPGAREPVGCQRSAGPVRRECEPPARCPTQLTASPTPKVRTSLTWRETIPAGSRSWTWSRWAAHGWWPPGIAVRPSRRQRSRSRSQVAC